MKVAGGRTRFLFYIAVMLAFSLRIGALASAQVETETINLGITSVDPSDFPTVRVRLLTAGAGSEPLADVSGLVVRENGIPIEATSISSVPVGADVVLVLDANADYLLFDDQTGLSRRDKVAAGIGRYAEQFMNPTGLDRVSIIAPDEAGENTIFLTTDANQPAELAAAAEAYAPLATRATPLNDMLAAAIDHLATRDNTGRFGAILLYTDGARLDRQLNYPDLVARAQAAGVPIFVAILGSAASPEEINNATGLAGPTNGQIRHIPQPEDADPLYEILQAQGRQVEIAYQSAARQTGSYEVSVSLGNRRALSGYDLMLAAPELSLDLPADPVRRAGSAPDTPLALLQPAALPFTIRIDWVDGIPRALTDVSFTVNGEPQIIATMPAVDAAGQAPLIWDISRLDAGTYTLEVAVTDELGFQATSTPVTINLQTSRPAVPTPTAVPTRTPLIKLPATSDGPLSPAFLAGAGVLLLAGLVTGVWLIRRRRTGRKATAAASPAPPSPPRMRATDRHVAILEWLDAEDEVSERIELLGTDVTLGREPGAVDIVIEEPSISGLHARVRRSGADEFWLYDEGSSRGTFLNYERLGLTPRALQHGDIIQLGRVKVRFVLELPMTGVADEEASI